MPAPEPGPGEILIKTEAAALNFFDILLCKGEYQEKPPLPFIPGAEIAGEIKDTGPGTASSKRQRVLATPQLPNGGWSEYVVVKEEDVFPIPESLLASEAASMFITYQTFYFALHRCGRLTERRGTVSTRWIRRSGLCCDSIRINGWRGKSKQPCTGNAAGRSGSRRTNIR
ncbi:alcohol dehydrogenase catalytic domain-containing protein [Alteribacillus bidgolensis]|nr:alcohol dehydrogenase catalytic domain-containing protein [Alteribacillus bidgolensis]